MTMSTGRSARFAGGSRHTGPLPRRAQVLAVAGLLGGEVIHSSVIQEHIAEWLPIGLFFVGISLVEGLLAVALITHPSLTVQRLTIGVSIGTALLWMYTRTLGLPLGPSAGHVEESGRLDILCSLLEVATAAVLLLRPGQQTEPATYDLRADPAV